MVLTLLAIAVLSRLVGDLPKQEKINMYVEAEINSLHETGMTILGFAMCSEVLQRIAIFQGDVPVHYQVWSLLTSSIH